MKGIYYIKINQKLYLGKSINITKRLIKHKYQLTHNRHPNKYMQNSFNKYKNTDYGVLISTPTLSEEELFLLEKELINIIEPKLNLSSGGSGGTSGVHHTQEWKQKMRTINLGENNPMFGKTGKDHPRSKSIIGTNITTKEKIYFNSIKEASEYVKGDFSSIAKVCRLHSNKIRYGHTWEYNPVSTILESEE